MKVNRWTWALASCGLVSLASVANAEEAQSQVLTALSSTTLSGYVDTSAIWKFGTGNVLPGRSFDGMAKQDGFNMNVVKLTLEKPLDENQFSAGYKVDLLFGPDAAGYNASVGTGASDVGLKQAYVALRAPVGNGIDFKIGTWDTIIGYEVFESGNNPNYSRSFGYALEPTQHTGVLATYQVNDIIGLAGGVANTWNAGINARAPYESQKTYMASISLTCPDDVGVFGGSTLVLGIVDGFGGSFAAAGDSQDTTSYYAGLSTKTPLESLTGGVAFDYVTDTPANAAVTDNWAWATSLYLLFEATEKLNLNARAEYMHGTMGTLGFFTGPTPDQIEVGGLTLTADYSLWENVITRAEFRWDRDFGGNKSFGNPADLDKNALSLAANIIYKF